MDIEVKDGFSPLLAVLTDSVQLNGLGSCHLIVTRDHDVHLDPIFLPAHLRTAPSFLMVSTPVHACRHRTVVHMTDQAAQDWEAARPPDRISRRQAARVAGVHPRTIDRWRNEGLLTTWRLHNGSVLVSRLELATLLKGQIEAAGKALEKEREGRW